MRSRIGVALKVLYPGEFGDGTATGRKKGFVRKRFSSVKNSLNKLDRMKLVIGIASFVVIVSVGYTIYAFNRFTTHVTNIHAARGVIESEKQRRNDLINNLVPPTINYLVFERQLFSHVAEIRKELTSLDSILEKNLNVDDIASALKSQAPTLMGIFENYPDLKASKPFSDLMKELIETENRVASARNGLNDAINIHNAYLTRFPAFLVAKILGYEKVTFFEVENGAGIVPDMKQLDSLNAGNVGSAISKDLADKISDFLGK
ncbi:MAG: LemA family protein [Candidatus Anammoxibacter sp.]